MKSKRIKLINTIDSHPATTHQKEYATSLGISLPEDLTKSDIKALIDRCLDEDSNAPDSLIDYARTHGIFCSSYIGYKFLHNLMFDNLSLTDLSAFFCYTVYQDLLGEIHGNLDLHPQAKVFYDFSTEYEKDFYFTSSLQDYYGDDLVTFGKNTVTFPDGSQHTLYGGSKYTVAYKTALNYLKEHLGLPEPSFSSPQSAERKTSFFSRLFQKKNRS